MGVSTVRNLQREWARIHRLAAWTAFWLVGEASTDDTIDAWHNLYPLPRNEMVSFLGRLRGSVSECVNHSSDDPLVRIVLADAGDPPPMPEHPDAQTAIFNAGAGLIMSSGHPDSRVLVVPARTEGAPRLTMTPIGAEAMGPPAMSIGEADLALSEATRTAASMVSSMHAGTPHLLDVRRRVGTVKDFYDVAEFPASFNVRAEKLASRADYLSAIVDTVRSIPTGTTWDTHILPLLTVIRHARTASMDYAVRELCREVK